MVGGLKARAAGGWALALLVSCADNVADPVPPLVPVPRVAPIHSELLVPGSILVINGDGFLSEPAGTTEVRFSAPDRRLETVRPIEVGRTQLQILVDGPVVRLFDADADGGRFVGTAEVVVRPGDQAEPVAASVPVDLRFAPGIDPVLSEVTPDDVAPGALLSVRGEGLLSAREGSSELHLVGTFAADGPSEDGDRAIDALLPLHAREDRGQGQFYLFPSALSLAPGTFTGQATLRTTDLGGTQRESEPLALTLDQGAPRVDGLSPAQAARGQRLVLRGTGFLPVDALAETATVVHAAGEFTPTGDEPEPVSLTLVPDAWTNDREIQLSLRTVLDARGRPSGFGERAGDFTGEVWVELYDGFDRATSAPTPLGFTILGPSQHIFLRYLPGFREALEDFGLAGAEDALRARILEVCARDYAGLRVRFSDTPPADWVEYVTVEIGGRDPNGQDLFGLDNTPAKDVGNVRLDELLGGRNVATEDAGNLPYGGVFLASFLTLSPQHALPSLIADPRFDEIFGPFSPALSAAAEPYEVGEALAGARARQADAAIDALANLVGTTITHEVGHALGLAAYDGEVHNPRDTAGGLMDRGADRPFAERAAIDGVPPARFLGENRAYLEALFAD